MDICIDKVLPCVDVANFTCGQLLHKIARKSGSILIFCLCVGEPGNKAKITMHVS